jgi:hypothetical protein
VPVGYWFGALESEDMLMSRITYASVSKPQPDRLEDAIEVSRQAAKMTGRHGAEARLLAAQLAGEQTGTLVFTIEFESPEKYAQLVEELDGDKELQDLQVALTRSTSPVVMLATSVTTEIPLPGKHKTGRGSVVEVHITKPVPGRFEAAIQEADTVATLLEKAGAVNVQAFQMMYAGVQSGSIGMAIEWPSVSAQAKAATIWSTDPAAIELSTAVLNGTSATTLLSSALYRDIPL